MHKGLRDIGNTSPVRYYCDCNKGFSGHSCENYDCTDGLFVCTNDKHTCDRDTKQCKCKPHHYGPDCSKNPCSISYHDIGGGIISQCNDRGTCRDDGPDNAICDCDEGWVGSDCSLEDCVVNPSVCIAPLVCDQTLRMCICPGNHIGQTCDSCRIGGTLQRLLTAVHHIVAYLTFLKVLFARDTGLVPWTPIHAAAQRAQYL